MLIATPAPALVDLSFLFALGYACIREQLLRCGLLPSVEHPQAVTAVHVWGSRAPAGDSCSPG